MKLLREFWKLFRKKKTPRETEHGGETDFGEEINYNSLQESIKPTKKSPPFLRKKREKVHIQVGLDFGTSATKVVFSQLGKRPFRVLNFNHNLPHYPSYCIPSLGCINEKGRLLLGVLAARALLNKEWDTGLQRLKVVVAGKYDNSFKDPSTEEQYYDHFKINNKTAIDPETITALFLAHVIRSARKTIKNITEYRSLDLDFAFNICMPIDHVENSNLKPVFEKIFAWAELIENEWDKSGKDFNPLKAACALEDRPEKSVRKVFAVPEAVASLASYLISLRKKAGLHAVIDLGAGTTDLSICNLFLDSENIKKRATFHGEQLELREFLH